MRAPLALPVLLLLGACTTTPRDGSPEIQTSAQANRESVEGAISAPLRDVNVLRTKIPPVLLEAMAEPYQRPRPVNCARIATLIAPLNEALGEDLDTPPDNIENPTMEERGKSAVLGLMAGAASDVIPFRGWVRKLSGAEQHDNLVRSAITAGAVRRAYLKGLGEARGCPPPATPNHLLLPPPPVVERHGPRFPIR